MLEDILLDSRIIQEIKSKCINVTYLCSNTVFKWKFLTWLSFKAWQWQWLNFSNNGSSFGHKWIFNFYVVHRANLIVTKRDVFLSNTNIWNSNRPVFWKIEMKCGLNCSLYKTGIQNWEEVVISVFHDPTI